MEYQEFVCAVEKRMNMKLKGGVKASFYTSVKNNGKERNGIMVVSPEVNISPTIYLEEFYERFQRGETLDKIVQDILSFYEVVKCETSWDISEFEQYEEIRNKVVFKLVHTGQNQKFLKNVPYIEMLDLSIVFYVLWEMNRGGAATMLVTNEHLHYWNVDKQDLYQAACENVKRLLPAQLFTMRQTVEEILRPLSVKPENLLDGQEDEPADFMYVLSNPFRTFGAACMVYPEMLTMAGDILGENFYILPSSIHEVILVPESKSPEQKELDEMVAEINETQVAEEEILSNHAYFYDRKGKRLMQQYVCC